MLKTQNSAKTKCSKPSLIVLTVCLLTFSAANSFSFAKNKYSQQKPTPPVITLGTLKEGDSKLLLKHALIIEDLDSRLEIDDFTSDSLPSQTQTLAQLQEKGRSFKGTIWWIVNLKNDSALEKQFCLEFNYYPLIDVHVKRGNELIDHVSFHLGSKEKSKGETKKSTRGSRY